MAEKINKSTVRQVDLDRYLGRWYEIARFDHRFERGLECVTAEYSMREDGKIRVVNRGVKVGMPTYVKEAVGKAKIPDCSQPGKLRVSFFWLFYSDYYILELEPVNYGWVLIGSSSPGYLWILSRTPRLEQRTVLHILSLAALRGYDINKLLYPRLC